MKLIVGLGNPGRKYEHTRHNVGFRVIDTLAGRHRLEWESARTEALVAHWRAASARLAKPLTFMNASGHAILDLLQFYKIDPADLLVVVDDVNLELGRLRTRGGGSAGGHNGLKSVIAVLGSDAFPRLRIGVGRGDGRWDLADRVLSKFDPVERPVIDEAVTRAADAVELFVAQGIGPVMNRFNRPTEREEAEKAEEEKEEKEDRG